MLDLTGDQPLSHLEGEVVGAEGATTGDEPRPTPGSGSGAVGGHVAESPEAAGQSEASADPLLRMVRAAVGRAAEHSGGDPADPSATAV